MKSCNKLTIAIPTWNGVNRIRPLLDSIEKNDGKKYVEIIVVDNCSDEKYDYILKNYKYIKLYRNERNIGPDGNFYRCVELAKNEYVWIIGDDDIIEYDAINKILDFIESNEPDSVFLNFGMIDNKTGKVITKNWIKTEKNLIFHEKKEFLRLVKNNFNFLSSAIHKKSRFLKINKEKYLGTNWLQYGIFLECLNYGKHGYIGETLLYNAGNSEETEANTGDNSLKIILNMISIIDNVETDRECKDILIKDAKRNLFRKAIISRVRNGKISIEQKKRLEILEKSITDNIVLKLIDIAPTKTLRELYKIYKKSILKRMYWKYVK